ncbi:hypothetical protein KC352_g20233 [Hortaea werneckii]|nr:hypothetical protein KC352_g20233 [Hortaea werneckii]
MNCAEVSVTTASSKRRRRRQVYNSFESLPYLFKANLEGLNDCTTTENENPVYPNPGPDVVYGDGMDANSPAFEGDCDSPTSYGQTYRAMGDSDEPSTSLSGAPMAAHTTTREVAYAPYEPAGFSEPTTISTAAVSFSAPVQYASAAETPTPEETVYDNDDQDSAQGACQLTSTPSPSASSNEPPAVTATLSPTNYPPISASSTRTGAGSTPTGTGAESGPSSTNRPAYATGDLDRYLPCVPGTFICTSATEFYTCNYAQDGSSEEWTYGYPRAVADGMECLTNLAPYSDSTAQYRQQGQTSAGYYRDDRYVRARPDGDCDEEGSILCTESGSAFDVCDQGGWVLMGAVAEGTQCRNGEIVAS